MRAPHLKIAFVISSLAKGGAERVVSTLSSEMAKKNDVSIMVFNYQIEYPYGGRLIDLMLPSRTGKIYKAVNLIKRIVKLKSIFKKEKYDIIFSFMESASIPSILTGYNVVVSVRVNPLMLDAATKMVMRVLYHKAVRVIVNSDLNKSILLNKFGLLRVSTIYNPLDISYIDKLSQEEVIIDYEYAVAVGRLEYQKGFDLLIDAFSKSNVSDDVRLLIFGEGSLLDSLNQQINSHNMSHRIFLMGKTDNPYKYLAKAKFFILSSRYEGFPNALIEALACSTPVISVNCPSGPSEIIKNGYNGMLIKTQNTEELVLAINKFNADKELGTLFRKTAKQSIDRFSVSKISNQWLSCV